MFLGDFHVHSTFSDGKHTIPDLVDYYGKRRFGVIAITDHLCESSTVLGKASAYLGCSLTEATVPLYLEILRTEAARAWDRYRMVVIPGFELTKNTVSNHRSAHVLGLGVSSFISADHDIADQLRLIREQGALSIAAHPVWTRKLEKQTYHLWSRRAELAELFDAWEVASGPYLFDEVVAARLPRIASSDLHHTRQMTSWKTVFHCERKAEAVLDAIRKQEIGFHFHDETKLETNIDEPSYRTVVDLVGYRDQRHALGNVVRL